MVGFAPTDGRAAAEAREGFAEFAKNEEILALRWEELLREHLHEWVAVFSDGQLATGTTMRDIIGQVPLEARDSAVIRFVEQDERALLL